MKSLLVFCALLATANAANNTTEAIIEDEPRDERLFQKVLHSRNFIDKTIFLKEFIDNTKRYKLITAPKNFGKSTLLDMARRFFQLPVNPETLKELDRKPFYLFKMFLNKTMALNITRYPDFIENHMGRYNVLYLTFEDIQGSTPPEIRQSIRNRIRHLLMAYTWLFREVWTRYSRANNYPAYQNDVKKMNKVIQGKANEADCVFAIKALMRFLKMYFSNDIMVLIDDYDAPITRAINLGIGADVINQYVQTLLGVFVKTTCYARHVLITGVSRLFKQGGDDPVNTLRHFYFLYESNHNPYFGFTEDEVERLSIINELDENQLIKLKQNHNGYRVQYRQHAYFNQAGVLQFIANNTADFQLPDDFVSKLVWCFRHQRFFESAASVFWNRKLSKHIEIHLTVSDIHHFIDTVNHKCSTYNPPTSYLAPLLDYGYLSFTPEKNVYQITNKLYENKLRQDFRNVFEQMYNVNITFSEVATVLHTIVNSDITTDKMLANLNTSLNQQFESLRDRELLEFEFYSLVFAAVFSNLRANKDAVYVRDIEKNHQSTFSADKLVLMSADRAIVLVVKLVYRKTLDLALQQARQYVPVSSHNITELSLVKYIGVNYNENRLLDVGRGKRRTEW